MSAVSQSPPLELPAGNAGNATLLVRLVAAVAVVAAGVAVQAAIIVTVNMGGEIRPGQLLRPLKSIPMTIESSASGPRDPTMPNDPAAKPGATAENPPATAKTEGKKYKFVCKEERTLDAKEYVGDQHVKRDYKWEGKPQQVSLWMVFSSQGLDRGHHPEICNKVAGKAEIPGGRKELKLDNGAPIQVYRFGTPEESQWIYYWTYSIRPPDAPGSNGLQRLWHSVRTQRASVTIEVFANDLIAQRADQEAVEAFVRQVDQEVQKMVGAPLHATRSSLRKPVTIQTADENETTEH